MEIVFDENIVLEGDQGRSAPVAAGAAVPEEHSPEQAQVFTVEAAAAAVPEKPLHLLYEIKGNDYELVYTKIRIRHIEERLNRSIATIMGMIHHREMPKLSELYSIFAGGFKRVGGGYVSFEQGVEIAESFIEANSYAMMIDHILYALDRDCPFLFRLS